MKLAGIAVLAAAAFVAAAGAQAQTTNVRVRGTITELDATSLTVKTRDGRDLKLAVPDDVAVAVATAVKFEDLKDGDFVGTTTKSGPGGTEVATEVHYLAPTTQPGQLAWDTEPNSKMTNANIAGKVVAAGNRELTLQWAGGSQKIVVPEGIPIVRAVPGSKADLKVGEYIFAVAQQRGDGGLNAPRIQVSKGGVRPPQ